MKYWFKKYLYFQLNSSSSLLSLGSLIGGIPSEKLTTIAPQQILETSRNPTFIQNILIAPEIVQKTYVTQVLYVNLIPVCFEFLLCINTVLWTNILKIELSFYF